MALGLFTSQLKLAGNDNMPILADRQPDPTYFESAHTDLKSLCAKFKDRWDETGAEGAVFRKENRGTIKLQIYDNRGFFRPEEYPNLVAFIKSSGLLGSDQRHVDFQPYNAFWDENFWHVDDMLVLNLATTSNGTTPMVLKMNYLTIDPDKFNFEQRMLSAIRNGYFSGTKIASLIEEAKECPSLELQKSIQTLLAGYKNHFHRQFNHLAAFRYALQRVKKTSPSVSYLESGYVFNLNNVTHSFAFKQDHKDKEFISGCRVFLNAKNHRKP